VAKEIKLRDYVYHPEWSEEQDGFLLIPANVRRIIETAKISDNDYAKDEKGVEYLLAFDTRYPHRDNKSVRIDDIFLNEKDAYKYIAEEMKKKLKVLEDRVQRYKKVLITIDKSSKRD